jgi:hypothetical protein
MVCEAVCVGEMGFSAPRRPLEKVSCEMVNADVVISLPGGGSSVNLGDPQTFAYAQIIERPPDSANSQYVVL